MLRVIRLPPRISCRGLVSSALLSRAWNNETVAELRNEAKLRGLSAKGNKAALASRIEEHEKALAFPGSRHSSSTPAAPTSNPTLIPGNPELPQMSATTVFDVKIPDLSQPRPLPPVQVPFLPDYWNSSPPDSVAVPEAPLPKIVVLAAADTHHAGSPGDNYLDVGQSGSSPSPIQKPTETQHAGSFLDDVSEDLGLPPVKKIKESFFKLF